MTQRDGASDPRLDPALDDLELVREEEQVLVGQRRAGQSPLFVISVFVVLAIGLFLLLNGRRANNDVQSLVTPVAGAALSAPEPPLVLADQQPAAGLNTPQSLVLGAMTTPMPVVVQTSAPSQPFSVTPAFTPMAVDPTQRRRAPIVVVDLDSGARASTPSASALGLPASSGAAAKGGDGAGPAMAALGPPSVVAALAGGQAAAQGGATGPRLNNDEAFAERVGEAEGPGRVVATSIRDLSAVVPQGAMIPGVLETAINSDLPGYTRAVVSRDVRSFDGKFVLIPRGSRLIGQYKSAVALGQSRAFVIWTRVVRPDGISVQIGSPGTDALGRGGLDGEVNRHFFARFGGSILLSVLNGAANAVGGTPGTQIAIGSPGAASSVAASALQGDSVPPTITVAQGEAIRIFVARDLDFSNVGPAR